MIDFRNEVVSSCDRETKIVAHSISRDGKVWTVRVPIATQNKFFGRRGAGGAYISGLLEMAMAEHPDGTED